MRSVTSGSNIFRRRLCLGSHNAETGLADNFGPAADEGTLLHPFASNRKLKRDHLTPSQQNLLWVADRSTEKLIGTAEHVFGADSAARAEWIEERLDVIGPDGEKLFDGQCDLAIDFRDATLPGVVVEDFKMGYIDVTEAASNDQLASYALMFTDYTGTDRAIVGINQPRGTERLTVALYERPQLEAARRELAAILHAAEDRNAPRIPGESQCRYCRAAAALTCEEFKRRFMPLALAPETRSIKTLDSDELGKFGILVKQAVRIAPAVMSEIALRAENGEMPGWELVQNGETRTVTDIVSAYNVLRDYFENLGGIDPKRFTACTKLSLTDLAEYFAELTGFSQGRAKAVLNDLLNPFIERKAKRPTPTPISPNTTAPLIGDTHP